MKVSRGTRLSLRVVALGYLFALRRRADRRHPLAHLLARPVGVRRLDLDPGRQVGPQPVAAHRRDHRAGQRRLRRGHGAGAGARTVPRPRAAPGRRRPARSRCRPSSSASRSSCCGARAAGSAPSTGPASRSSSACRAWSLATIFVTLPFVVREVEPVLHEIGTRPGAGRLDARRQRVADLLADHAAGHPVGPDLRRRAHRRPGARRVRRGHHGLLRLRRGSRRR